MAFFALLWKARTIEKYRLNYEREKINSIVMGNTQIEKTLVQKWRHYRYDTQKRISRTFKEWYPEGSGVSNFLLYLRTDQTFPNFLLKSLMGFIGGIILTYLCFMFFVFQLSISLIHATIMSFTIGVLLTLGLAFSYRIRCLVFLLIPQLFSRVGRYTLTCYALVLILTGPATNTLKNSEVLSESMACSQEQIKVNVHQLNDSLKIPFHAIKDSLKLMMERLQMITTGVKEAIIKMNRLILSIVSSIHSSFGWLKSGAELCNRKLGTPYERCTNVLKNGVADCRDALGPDYNWLCNVGYVAKLACVGVTPYKSFCHVVDFMDETIVATIKKKLKNFSSHIRAMFHVELHIQYSHSFTSNGSRSAGQVAAGIVTEIRNRADPLLTWLSWSSCVTSLFLVLIIFRAKYYQHMYETRSRFDNRYITRDLQELDLKRQRQGRETVLPLNRRERAKYITTTSFRLLASEKVNMNRSVVFMSITTFKLLIHMIADYSLYWVLMTIRYHGRFQSNLIPGVPHTGAHISGDGFAAKLFRSVLGTLDIPLAHPSPSPIPCLPNPYPPDLRRYAQIGVLIIMLWFFALFEPYGLRLRHLVMGHYRPERAKARSSWLYNHILRTRAGFMKFARRKLHREFKYSSETHLTFRQWMSDHIPFQCLKCLLRVCPPEPHCLLCGLQYSQNDFDTRLTRCATPTCPGIYCTSCFMDIGHLCTICLSPIDYGDLSDVSLEKGSSDDSDSEEEAGNAMMRPEGNDRPFIRMQIQQRSNDNRSPQKDSSNRSNQRIRSKEMKVHSSRILRSVVYKTILQNIEKYERILHKQTLHKKSSYDLTKIRRINRDVRKRSINIRDKNNMTIYNKIKGFLTIGRYFMTTDEGLDMAYHKDDQESNKINKNQKDTKPSNKDDTNKQKASKDNDTKKKPKKIKTQTSSARLKSKKSREKIGEFHAFFSKHWRNIKFSLIPCIHTQVKKDEFPKERKNHKRRKKRKQYTDTKESETIISKVKKEIKNTRNYRISAFLADLEWTKRDYGKRNSKDGSVFQNTDGISKSNIHKPNTIVTIAQVKSPTAPWCNKPNKHGICPCSDRHCTCPKPESSLKTSTQTGFAHNALKRFRNRVKLLCSSSNILEEKLNKASAATGGSFIENEATSEHLLRRMNYYHSLLEGDFALENEKTESDPYSKIYPRHEILLRGLNSVTNIKKETPTKTNQNITVSRSKSFLKNKSTYVYKKKNTTATQDRLKTTDTAQETKKTNSDIEKSFDNIKQAKNPISLMKNVYSSIFGSSCKQETGSAQDFKVTAEKGIVAEPDTIVASCQYARTNFRDISTQIHGEENVAINNKCLCEAGVGVDQKTCTCATQHIMMNRNIGTMHCRHDLCKQRNEEVSNESVETYSSSSQSSSSTKSDETKTDTTVCSLATVDYTETNNRKKYRVKVVTKTNQSTLTDKTRCHDISTFTDDWWSPILEKKNTQLPKEYEGYRVNDKYRKLGRSRRKSRGVETDGKFVTFKSRTQVIPTGKGIDDIMSPSRYLLESQRYYNELFSYKFSPQQVYPVSFGQKHQDNEKIRPPIGRRSHHHHQTKRLEECYSPRRQTSPRKRHGDAIKRCDSPRWRQHGNVISRQKHK